MLVFGMKDVEYVVIDNRIVVRVKWDSSDIKLCIDAPKDVSIERDKVYEKRCHMQGTVPKWDFEELVKEKKKPAGIKLAKASTNI